jgi:hypothetical protein
MMHVLHPVCPHCLGEGGHMSGYYEPEFYGCRCCNPDEENENNPTRVWRWKWWVFQLSEWRAARRMDKWVDSEVEKMRRTEGGPNE